MLLAEWGFRAPHYPEPKPQAANRVSLKAPPCLLLGLIVGSLTRNSKRGQNKLDWSYQVALGFGIFASSSCWVLLIVADIVACCFGSGRQNSSGSGLEFLFGSEFIGFQMIQSAR